MIHFMTLTVANTLFPLRKNSSLKIKLVLIKRLNFNSWAFYISDLNLNIIPYPAINHTRLTFRIETRNTHDLTMLLKKR